MSNLLKMEKYQLTHNMFYWCGMAGVFLTGLLTADTYVPEVMGPSGKAASSLTDIFNGMIYDSTFLLIVISSILALILGQEFSSRTVSLEVSAGHSRKVIFISKTVVYLMAFNIMALVYPAAGCIREFARFGFTEAGTFFYNVIKGTIYSFWLNSAVFLIAIFICCCLRSAVKAVAVTAVATFVLSLYLGYGMMLKLPVYCLVTFQIREVVSTAGFIQLPALLTGAVWISLLIFLSWACFRRCDLK